jgi:hypothetical protein
MRHSTVAHDTRRREGGPRGEVVDETRYVASWIGGLEMDVGLLFWFTKLE